MSRAREAIKKVIKVDRKTFFNPSGWFDLQTIVDLNTTIMDVLRATFYLPKPTPKKEQETFEEAVKRQKLTKKDLEQTHSTYKTFAVLFAILGIIDFCYTFYLLFAHFSILGFILGIASTALFFGQAFRFDFWALQISKKKLGLTFHQWKDHYLGNTGK